MKVTVSCAGRFHAYNLAAQLHRHSVLDRLITTYPRYEVIKYDIPYSHIVSFPIWEVLNRGLLKGHQHTGINPAPLHPLLYALFEKWSASKIPKHTDVYIGWSAFSESGLRKAQRLGAITVLERGSSHIVTQTQLIKDEYRRNPLGKSFEGTHQRVIDQELREYDLADYISVPSTFVKRTFIERGFPEEKIIQNPYGVSLTHFRPGQKLDNIFRVIYVGQMSLRKGVHYLIEAFKSLSFVDVELVLIGGMTAEIKPLLEDQHPKIKYLGIKPQKELSRFYQQASVFAICSIEEGMAMVQAQAMACGLPVICTTNTGGEDLIRDGRDGFVLPIRSADAIREKLEWMYLNQDKAKQMGESASHRVSTGFTWDDYGDRYFSFLKSKQRED